MYIEKIKSPAFLKGLNLEELNIVADETRQAVLNRVSKHGGHVGPNLGFVEATVALHYVFDAPKDKLVFDVSHQCYPHKVLTGRASGFLGIHVIHIAEESRSYTHIVYPGASEAAIGLFVTSRMS